PSSTYTDENGNTQTIPAKTYPASSLVYQKSREDDSDPISTYYETNLTSTFLDIKTNGERLVFLNGLNNEIKGVTKINYIKSGTVVADNISTAGLFTSGSVFSKRTVRR